MMKCSKCDIEMTHVDDYSVICPECDEIEFVGDSYFSYEDIEHMEGINDEYELQRMMNMNFNK